MSVPKVKPRAAPDDGKSSMKLHESTDQGTHTCQSSMQIAKKTFTISVKKFTLTGLKRNFPSTFDIYTSIGCIKRAEFQMSTLFTYLFSPLLSDHQSISLLSTKAIIFWTLIVLPTKTFYKQILCLIVNCSIQQTASFILLLPNQQVWWFNPEWQWSETDSCTLASIATVQCKLQGSGR